MLAQKLLLNLSFVTYVIILVFPYENQSFHIATKIRHKHICGKRLYNKVFNLCKDSVSFSLEREKLIKRISGEASAVSVPENQRVGTNDMVCCRGNGCKKDKISQNCEVW